MVEASSDDTSASARPVRQVDDTDAAIEPIESNMATESPDLGAMLEADAEPGIWDRTDWIACGAMSAVTLVLVLIHMRAYTLLSPFDELQHVDYAIKAGRFAPPHPNDRVGFEAMADAACRGVDAPLYVGPPCGLDAYDPADFQELGVNTSASQFPFYYTVTGLMGRMVTGLGLVNSQVAGLRVVGAVWSAAAWSVIWYVLAVLRIPRPQRAVTLLLLIFTPLVVFHSATVNADAVLMLTGALAVLATLKYEAKRLHGGFLIAVFVALYFVEATNILVISACGAYLIVRMALAGERSIARWVAPALIFPLIFTLRFKVAAAVHRSWLPKSPREVTAPMFAGRDADTAIDWSLVLAQLDAIFMPVVRTHLPPVMRTEVISASVDVTNWLLIAAMFLTAVGAAATADVRSVWLTRVGMLTLLAAGPFYTFSFAYFSNVEFPAPGRFGLPLIVLIAIGTSAALRTRVALGIAAAVATGTALTTTLTLLLA